MPLYGFQPVVRQGRTLDEFKTPFADYLDAKFSEGMQSNVSSLLLESSRLGATYGEMQVSGDQPMSPDTGPMYDFAPAPRLDATSAMAIAKEAGVNVNVADDGIPQAALDLLIKRKKDEAARADAINRSPTGLRSVAGVGAALAAGVLDPLNIAAAFVPVVGPSRYALMLERAAGGLERAGVRAATGFIEGTAGMAMLEPATYALHQQLQDDYKALDSVLNIGFGGVLGGGLHTIGGAVADVLRTPVTREFDRAVAEAVAARELAAQATPLQREAALRTSVAQTMDGHLPQVDPLLKPGEDIQGAVEKASSPDTQIVGDPQASKTATDALQIAPKDNGLVEAQAHLAEAEQNLVKRWNDLSLSQDVLKRSLAEVKGTADQIDELAKAARAASACSM